MNENLSNVHTFKWGWGEKKTKLPVALYGCRFFPHIPLQA